IDAKDVPRLKRLPLPRLRTIQQVTLEKLPKQLLLHLMMPLKRDRLIHIEMLRAKRSLYRTSNELQRKVARHKGLDCARWRAKRAKPCGPAARRTLPHFPPGRANPRPSRPVPARLARARIPKVRIAAVAQVACALRAWTKLSSTEVKCGDSGHGKNVRLAG